MKMIGSLFRYILNINTIWGFMVLIAIAMCAWQQFRPEKNVLPASLFSGEDTFTLKFTNVDDKEVFAWTTPVTGNGDLKFPETEVRRTTNGNTVLFTLQVDSKEVEGAHVLTWDLREVNPTKDGEETKPIAGTYSVEINGKKLGQNIVDGRRVTLNTLTDAALDFAKTGFSIAFNLVPVMILFLGLMKVGEDAGIVQAAARLLYPIIRFLFPQVPKDHPANSAILMNITTSILGVGNAATPFGLKAMKELQDLNPHKDVASDSQIMLLAYNTAGFALLPTTLIAVRKSAGTNDPFSIVLPCMIAGAVSTVVAIAMVKSLAYLPIFSLQSAVAEEKLDELKSAAHDTHVHAEEPKSDDAAKEDKQ